MRHRLGALAVVHPVPSAITAVLVASLAWIAATDIAVALLLGVAMFSFQVSIGALNDVVDVDEDRLTGRDKPIPAGLVSPRAATWVVMVGGTLGLLISAAFGLVVLVLGAAGYGAGIAYDLAMRRLGLGWVCFAAAFPLLLAWTWVAAAGELPPGWPSLLPLAALAGPAIHLANSLVDAEADARAGRTSLATQLGADRAGWTLTVVTAIVYVLAWMTLLTLSGTPAISLGAALVATVAAGLGMVLSIRGSRTQRETGWLLQAMGLAVFAVGWVAAAAST